MPAPLEIIDMVDTREQNRFERHDRQDKDFDRYNLQKYTGEVDEEGGEPLDGYKKFTSNDPRTGMNLAIHLLSTAPMLVRVRQPRAKKPEREQDNIKELWALGILEAINERRVKLDMPELQDSLTGQSLIRGSTAQRVLFIKENEPTIPGLEEFFQGSPQTSTFVDVQDWDPRNTYWGMGRHGLSWACHKVMKTMEEIQVEWGVNLDINGPSDPDHEMAVYDYLDESINTVVTEQGIVLKEETPHGMGGVPVDLHTVGGLPFFQAKGHDYDVNYGESFYQSSREVFDQQNFMLSILAELSSRSIKQGLLIFSADGSMTLENDPRVSGAETSLKTNQENVVGLPPMEMVREASTYMGVIAQMVQRGTFPSSAFGELAFQLSGFAITQLRQGMEAPLSPAVKTVTHAMKGIFEILSTAYESGNFDAMTLSGRMQGIGRQDFEQTIPPELLQGGGRIDIKIVPQLPQDDANKVALANLYVQGDIPLADHRFVRENILMMQDVNQVERAVQEQLAKNGSPASMAFSNMLASAEQGDMELARIWMTEFQLVMTERLIAMAQTQAVASQIGIPTNGGGGLPPTAAPTALQGTPPPTPGIGTPLQAGSLQPAGAERPGAQLAGPLDRGIG